MESLPFVRVAFGNSTPANVDLDSKIRTYLDIAEAGLGKVLGKSAAAEVPIDALSLRGPVVAVSKELALAALKDLGVLDLSEDVNRTIVMDRHWFLLEINSAESASGAYEVLPFTLKLCSV